jgi:hypothetical protein
VGNTGWNWWLESILRSDKENLRQVIDSENERKIGEESRRERERKRFLKEEESCQEKRKVCLSMCQRTVLYSKNWFIIDDMR